MHTPEKIGLVVILLFLLFVYASYIEIASRGKPKLRPLPAIESLRKAVNKAIESSRPVHVSIGTGSVGRADTAETAAGLSVLDYLQQQRSSYRLPVILSAADPAAFAAAYDLHRKASIRGGNPPGRAYFVAPQRIVYAAGAAEILKNESALANVMIGPFGYEYLLLGEMTHHQGIEQVGGTTDPRVLPFVCATSEGCLIGEEIFAAGAYLTGDAGRLAGLMAQDRMRTLLVVFIVLGMLLKSLGLL